MKEKTKTKICKHCKTEISYNAKVCPQCRKKQSGKLKWIIIVFAILIVIVVASSGGDNGTKTASNTTDGAESATIQEEPIAKSESNSETLSADITESADNIATNEVEDDTENIPTEYKSALNKAYNYSDIMHMSKAGIYNQLTSEYGEKFSAEAAQYAIDNMEADWNANALIKAKDYSDTMHMSKAGIYDQLISEYGEQFTPEEAQYAVDNVEADWNANALAKAKSYQETMDMSPSAIHDQLTSEYGEQFTQEEADYAIANLD